MRPLPPAFESIATDLQLRRGFPSEVKNDLRRWERFPEIDDANLLDLRAKPFVTIDHESSRDLDQAVWVAPDGPQGWYVWYALADASHYVRPGSALFEEALARGASFYFPGHMFPMLPRVLSEGVVSLNPEVDRRALVFKMLVSRAGLCLKTEIYRARIRSQAKLSFRQVQAYYDSGESFASSSIQSTLNGLREVGRVLVEAAREREVVRYRRTEVEVNVLTKPAMRFVASKALRLEVERYNEELSLLCNIEGAKFLRECVSDPEVHAIFRVHPSPERERVEAFSSMTHAFARAHALEPARWIWKRGQRSLAEYLEQLPEEGALGRLAASIHRQAVIINGRSCFRAEPGIHHGVGAEVYARFSAPMREIVGVFLHKEVLDRIEQRASSAPAQNDDVLRERVVEASNRARDTQKQITRACNRVVLDQLFSEAPGEQWDATVMGIERSKVHLRLEAPPIDVKVYRRDLEAQYETSFSVGEDKVRLLDDTGGVVLRLGDPIRVRVAGKDERRDRWVLAIESPRT